MEIEKQNIDTEDSSNSGIKSEIPVMPQMNSEKKTDWKKEVLDFFKVIIIALIITNLLNVFVFTLSQVRQSSMETTLIAGDQLVVEKLSYNFNVPKRGDIIVFIQELSVDNSIKGRFVRLYEDMYAKIVRREGHYRLVKRVIGLPGDVIDIREGKVFVNNEELKENYLQQPTYEKALEYPFTVPSGEYFVMGDNRKVSHDSRDFGSIKKEQIEGKVVFRFWPLNKLGGLN